ncbi:MAG: Zn-ribbon containing protein [Halobacteria archaeon]|nr:Zn-ribbon containing protein [Halobacteria archaeon]
MPHECVNCGNVFDDGSDQMLDGCPECGGSKFLYAKKVPDDSSGTDTPSSADTSDETEEIIEAKNDESTPRNFGGKISGSESDSEKPDPDTSSPDTPEDDTQTPPEYRPADSDELREELMEQFETIKIVEPGSYELNLMNLYDSEEKIIALQEDGRYQVSLPSTFQDSE